MCDLSCLTFVSSPFEWVHRRLLCVWTMRKMFTPLRLMSFPFGCSEEWKISLRSFSLNFWIRSSRPITFAFFYENFPLVISLSFFARVIIAIFCRALFFSPAFLMSPSDLTWFNFSRVVLICSSCSSISNWINLDSWWCLIFFGREKEKKWRFERFNDIKLWHFAMIFIQSYSPELVRKWWKKSNWTRHPSPQDASRHLLVISSGWSFYTNEFVERTENFRLV